MCFERSADEIAPLVLSFFLAVLSYQIFFLSSDVQNLPVLHGYQHHFLFTILVCHVIFHATSLCA